MSDYLPPGAASDPNAPFNQPPALECRSCGNRIFKAGDHESGCDDEGLDADELLTRREEDAKHERAEQQLEEQKIAEMADERED
jgi:hypothetical protein